MVTAFANMSRGERPDIEGHIRDLNKAHDELVGMLLTAARRPLTDETRQELLGTALHYNFMAAGVVLICYQIATTAPGPSKR